VLVLRMPSPPPRAMPGPCRRGGLNFKGSRILEQNIVMVRSGKGDKDRRTILPESFKDDLIAHLSEIRSLYEQDRENGIHGVYLPGAHGKEISPCRQAMGMVLAFSFSITFR
ncbi:MAG: hypothetical protein LDL14_01865, partial [Nitrospira sp.]|nr:hypothetical protein [Nitrospira sp.]